MFTKYKQQISLYLTDFLQKKETYLSSINPWGKDFINKIQPFILSGKMFRGSLVLLTEEKLAKPQTNGLVIASALELIQAGILVHDDIIDEDDLRRGQKSIHAQYADIGKELQVHNFHHFGKSLGICAGDLAFFLAFELINNLTVEPQIKQQILNIFSVELQTVGLAEMQDTVLGNTSALPSEKEILNLYRTKTGRYSFSLALMLGAVLTKQSKEIVSNLEKLGEIMGIIYQIKDDELSLFGDSQITGKPIGSDISRANKTLYYLYLSELASPQEKILLQAIFGNKNLPMSEIEYVRNLVKSLSIDQKIRHKIDELNKQAKNILKEMKLPEDFKQQLRLLFDLFQNRQA